MFKVRRIGPQVKMENDCVDEPSSRERGKILVDLIFLIEIDVMTDGETRWRKKKRKRQT